MTGERRMVTILTFHDPMEAEICRAKLEDSGITCFIQREAYQTLLPGQFPWEIRLKVPMQDIVIAKKILQEQQSNNESRQSPTKNQCPQCSSEDVIDRKMSRLMTIIISLILSQVVPLRLRRCKSCNHIF